MPAFADTYDQAGNLLEHKHYTPDFIDDQHLERIDAETVAIHSKMGNKRQMMKFDESGKLIRLQIFFGLDGRGGMLDDTRYRYDPRGREIQEDEFDEDASLAAS